MSVRNKKLNHSRISSCLFNLMLSTAALTTISTFPVVSEIHAMEITKEILLRDLHTVKNALTDMSFKPVTFPLTMEKKEEKKEEKEAREKEQNFGHQVNAYTAISTKIDNPTGTRFQFYYPECDLFNEFLKLANEKDSDFLNTMTQHMKDRGNKIIKLIEDKNKSRTEQDFNPLTPHLLLQLRTLEDFVMKTNQLRNLRLYLQNKAEGEFKKIKESAEEAYQLSKTRATNHKELSIIPKHKKTQEELEARKLQSEDNIRAESKNPTLQSWHRGELAKIESEIRINEANKEAEEKKLEAELLLAKKTKDSAIEKGKADCIKKIKEWNYIYDRIFEYKGSSLIGKKKAGRLLSGADTDRTKFTEYALLDAEILEAKRLWEADQVALHKGTTRPENPGMDIVKNSRIQVIKAWSDRYENDAESQRNKETLAQFFGYEDPTIKPTVVEQKESKAEDSKKKHRKERSERPARKERSSRREAASQTQAPAQQQVQESEKVTTTTTTTTVQQPVVEIKQEQVVVQVPVESGGTSSETTATTTTSSSTESPTTVIVESKAEAKQTPLTLAAEQMAIQNSITEGFIEKKKEEVLKPDNNQSLTPLIDQTAQTLPANSEEASTTSTTRGAGKITYAAVVTTVPAAGSDVAQTPSRRGAGTASGKKNGTYTPNGARGKGRR